jgi:hypothetical protein
VTCHLPLCYIRVLSRKADGFVHHQSVPLQIYLITMTLLCSSQFFKDTHMRKQEKESLRWRVCRPASYLGGPVFEFLSEIKAIPSPLYYFIVHASSYKLCKTICNNFLSSTSYSNFWSCLFQVFHSFEWTFQFLIFYLRSRSTTRGSLSGNTFPVPPSRIEGRTSAENQCQPPQYAFTLCAFTKKQ